MRAIHRTRRWSFEVDSFAVVAAAVARTLEFVFAGLPVGRAAEMRAPCINHEQTVRRTVHPDAIFLLEFGVDSESEIGRVANLEKRVGFEECAGKKESKERQKPRCQLQRVPAALRRPVAALDAVLRGRAVLRERRPRGAHRARGQWRPAAELTLPAAGGTLRLAALNPGSREYLRASVDYDGIGRERARIASIWWCSACAPPAPS